jgi:D-serine deaminase-like pyridoxal phosphate-dependent protein
MVEIGAHIGNIDTPSLLINLDNFENNIDTMAEYIHSIPAELRPHSKTHKCPIIAHKQLNAGAIGITCAKLGEAEAMVAAGIRDILIANQVVGEPKVTRLTNLAKHSDIIVAVENYRNVRHLDSVAKKKDVKLNVIIEVDVGNNRCGTIHGEPTLKLAREISQHSSLNMRGLMGYEGFCQNILNIEDRRFKTNEAMKTLVSTRDLLDDNGFNTEIVSAGGTGTHMITGEYPGVTEVEAGSYIFMDTTYSRVEGLENYDYALTVLGTIVSLPRSGVAICDVGRKAITFEPNRPMPIVKNRKGIRYEASSEEHGRLSIDNDSELSIGDKIEFIVSHCCTNVNLYDQYHCIRNESVEAIWDITARGKSQ